MSVTDSDGRARGSQADTPTEAGYTALWWAKVQSAGPLLVSPETPAVAGLTRAPEPDGRSVWMLPTLPAGAGHGILAELGAPPVAVEQPNETARVLAICLTCCWTDRGGPAWPGVAASLSQVKAVYAGFRGRAEQSSDLTLIIGSLRRLHATSWLIWNEKLGEVRLGPRVSGWGPGQLAGLREVCRILPDPPRTASTPPTAPAHVEGAAGAPIDEADERIGDEGGPRRGAASYRPEGEVDR